MQAQRRTLQRGARPSTTLEEAIPKVNSPAIHRQLIVVAQGLINRSLSWLFLLTPTRSKVEPHSGLVDRPLHFLGADQEFLNKKIKYI